MKKIGKNLIIGLFAATLPILAITTLTTSLTIQWTKLFEKVKTIEDEYSANNNISAFTSYHEEIIGEHSRTPNSQYYSTKVLEDDPNFKYPGYDHNYEDSFQGVDKAKYDKVFNERVNWANKDWKYSDGKWIASQIYKTNGETITNELLDTPQLKIHPAQKNLYAENVRPETKSITKRFRFSTNITGMTYLGLYAPAGEIIKIRLSDETFAWTKKHNSNPLELVINYSYWDNYDFNNSGKISNRYPFIRTWFKHDEGFRQSSQQEYYFGSPFGGSIAINLTQVLNQSQYSPYLNDAMDIEFEVSGAVQELHYVHGYTTEKDWNNQMNKVKNNIITAPSFSIASSFFSFGVPFTTKKEIIDNKEKYRKQIAHLNLEEVVYPKPSVDKWQQFFYVSYYFSSRDKRFVRRLNMEFCDDIWNGAAAWGGNENLSAPLDWSNIFYRDPSYINITNGWGVFHEINHSHEQNLAFFSKRGHGQTNQVSMVAYSMINDASRFRSEVNPYGSESGHDWSRLSNGYWNIKNVIQNNGAEEYSLYAALLYSFGPYLYMDYVRDDVVNHPNTANGWTGISEIIRLSHYFKLDLYKAFQDYSKYWSDWTTPTQSEQAQLNEIKNKYPSYFFNANMYASGSYIYDYETKNYSYAGDYAAPYEIPAGLPYTFDFENFINSISNDFNWTELKFSAKSKNGSKLELDPNNGKKLIYTPINPIDFSEDEFDVGIVPINTNQIKHVPEYRWKIKVKPSVNGVTAENVDLTKLTNTTDDQEFEYLRTASQSDVTHSRIVNTYNVNPAFYTQNKEGIRIKSIFIPQKTGIYSFDAKWDDKIKIYVNGEQKFKATEWTDRVQETFAMKMNANQKYLIDVLVINTGGVGNFEFHTKYNGTSYNIINDSLSPHIDTIFSKPNYLQIIIDPTTKYKDRSFDPYLLQRTLTQFLQEGPNIFVDVNEYDFESTKSPDATKNMKEIFTDKIWEVWTSDPIDLKIKYKNPTYVAGLLFGHRTNNHNKLRPEKIKITGKNSTTNQTYNIYDGEYGTQNNDKFTNHSLLNFDQSYLVDEIDIVFTDTDKEGGGGISLQFIQTLKTNYYGMNSIIRHSDIQYSYWWRTYKNGLNGWYKSKVNNSSKYTNRINSSLKFKVNANGFNIVGTTKQQLPIFDVYINGVKTNISLELDSNNDSTSLFYYATPNVQELEVEIVYRGGGELIIDYIATVGKMANSIR